MELPVAGGQRCGIATCRFGFIKGPARSSKIDRAKMGFAGKIACNIGLAAISKQQHCLHIKQSANFLAGRICCSLFIGHTREPLTERSQRRVLGC